MKPGPRLIERAPEKRLVGRVIDHNCDSFGRHDIQQLANLVGAAGVYRRETSKIHEDDIAGRRQAAEHGTPCAIPADEIGDSETAVMVGEGIKLPESAVDGIIAVQETVAEAAAEKVEKLVRLH